MKFDHLKSFHRVAVTRSFTKAAQELFLTQPAVSQQIQLLEHRLGIKLFDRMGKMVGLTSEGEILLSYTERLFRINDEIEIHFGKLRDLETGKITVGSTAVIGTYFLPIIIGDYNRKYPKRSIELQNIEAAKRTVIEGYGITIIPEISIRRELHVGLLKRIHLDGFDLSFDYYLFFKKKKIFTTATEAFMKILIKTRLLSHSDNLIGIV